MPHKNLRHCSKSLLRARAAQKLNSQVGLEAEVRHNRRQSSLWNASRHLAMLAQPPSLHRLQDLLHPLAHVEFHCLGGALGIALLHRRKQRLVLVGQALGAEPSADHPQRRAKAQPETFGQFQKDRRLGEAVEFEVELVIVLEITAHVAPRDGLIQPGVDGAQSGHLFGGGESAGAAGQLGFDGNAGMDQLADRPGIEHWDRDPAIALKHQRALGGQSADGFAHRGHAGAELMGQALDRHRRAGGHFAEQQEPAHPAIDPLMGGKAGRSCVGVGPGHAPVFSSLRSGLATLPRPMQHFHIA